MSTTPAPQDPQPDKRPGPEPPSAPTPSPKPSKVDSFGRGVRTVIYIIIAVVTTIFLFVNSQSVEIDYVFGTAETPLFVALGIALILGVLLTLGAVGIWKVRHRG